MASDKLMRERLRAGTPRGSAVEMVVSEMIVRRFRQGFIDPGCAFCDVMGNRCAIHGSDAWKYARPWKGDK